MKVSIKLKSSIFLASLLTVSLVLLSILILDGIKNNQVKEYEDHLSRQVKTANSYIRQAYILDSSEDPAGFLKNTGNLLARQLDQTSGMHVVIYDMSGSEVANSIPFAQKSDSSEIVKYALDKHSAYYTLGDRMQYAAPLYSAGSQIGVIEFGYSIKSGNDFYEKIRLLFVTAGLLVLAASFAAGYMYFGKITNAVLILKSEVEKVVDGKYELQEHFRGNDEISELNKGICHMSRRIEKNIRELEDEQSRLHLAIEKLKNLEQQQKSFIGNITHEFKTPLTAIQAYADLLGMYPDDRNLLSEAYESISKESKRLCMMLEKVLQLSALEKYDFELQWQQMDIKELLEEMCNRMDGKSKKFGIAIEKALRSATIVGDVEAQMQIFINLLDNAIKYNRPNGKIFVKSYTLDEHAFIEIEDTGIGIPRHVRDKIFEPFYTVDKSRFKDSAGTGLGLSLVKELVEKQNGQISIEDGSNGATKFLISYPLCK